MQLMFSPSQKLHKLQASFSGLLSATPIHWLALLILRRKAKEKASLHAVKACSQKKGTVQKLSYYAGRSAPTKNAIYFFIRGDDDFLFQIAEIRLQQLRDSIISNDELYEMWKWFAASMKQGILSIPDRIKDQIPNVSEHDKKKIMEMMVAMLDELAEDADASIIGADGDLLRVSLRE